MNPISNNPTPPPSPEKKPRELTQWSRYRIQRLAGRLNMSAQDLTDAQLIKIAGALHISCQYVKK